MLIDGLCISKVADEGSIVEGGDTDENIVDSGCVFALEYCLGRVCDEPFEGFSDDVVSDEYETSFVGIASGTELAAVIAEVIEVDDCCCVVGDELETMK